MKNKDEFFTQITDIEKELVYYKDYLRNKIIYCNCDNPEQSAFWKYFHLNFEKLNLKKLVSTFYSEEEKSYKTEYTGGEDFNINLYKKEFLEGNGDFRSKECIEILKNSDIVITNPPFSLFREYVAQLEKYNKKYLILGNQNAITYKEIFPLIKENKLWYGKTIHSGDIKFNVPKNYSLTAYNCGVDEDGKTFIRVKGIRWFTNIGYPNEKDFLILTKSYNSEEYSTYDNIDAINVNKTKDIPKDYRGVIGVPITFLDKYNSEQFEILGCTANKEYNSVEIRERSERAKKLIGEGRLKGAKCVGGNSNIYIDKNNYVHVLYQRLLIRRRI